MLKIGIALNPNETWQLWCLSTEMLIWPWVLLVEFD